MERVCVSCKRRIANIPGSVYFFCPNCGKYEIVRCSKCRKMIIQYQCPNCNFVGPN